jgi:ATP-dependent RNA helicase RhlE
VIPARVELYDRNEPVVRSFLELGLGSRLVRRLSALGYRTPWPIQAEAIPAILAGRDVIGLAQTGKGKTLAFAAPLAQQLLAAPGPGAVDPDLRTAVLILCPTRELAQQVASDVGAIVAGTALRCACVYGKAAIGPQAATVRDGVDLVAGTPGRVRELLERGDLTLAGVRHVVVDEADRMLDFGFRPQITSILEGVPPSRQSLLFTATMPSPVETLARPHLRAPVRIEVDPHTTAVEHVEQRAMPINDRNKVPLLLHLLEGGLPRGVLVFCRTRRRVGWVGAALRRHDIAVGVLHGDRSQAQRQRALEGFRERRIDVVVATEVAARGLHVPAVRTVVNYDVPLVAEEFVHRVGRAGHGGKIGQAITFIAPSEEGRWRQIVQRLEIAAPDSVPPDFTPPHRERRPEPAGPSPLEPGNRRAGRDRGRRRRGMARGRGTRSTGPIPKNERPGGGVKRREPEEGGR